MTALTIVHLYAREMNIYGDNGNLLVLRRRLEWRGFRVAVRLVNVGDPLPANPDIILGGGGQDAGQLAIEADLRQKASRLRELAEAGVSMLMVCGMYQMFCRRFVTHDQKVIDGIGVLAAETIAGNRRLIGNLNVKADGQLLVGYENHSGQTYLDQPSSTLGRVVKGAGNNGHDKTEGCVYNNVIGTYLHGPALGKNPALADRVIAAALKRRGHNKSLFALDDGLEHQARSRAARRPR